MALSKIETLEHLTVHYDLEETVRKRRVSQCWSTREENCFLQELKEPRLDNVIGEDIFHQLRKHQAGKKLRHFKAWAGNEFRREGGGLRLYDYAESNESSFVECALFKGVERCEGPSGVFDEDLNPDLMELPWADP